MLLFFFLQIRKSLHFCLVVEVESSAQCGQWEPCVRPTPWLSMLPRPLLPRACSPHLSLFPVSPLSLPTNFKSSGGTSRNAVRQRVAHQILPLNRTEWNWRWAQGCQGDSSQPRFIPIDLVVGQKMCLLQVPPTPFPRLDPEYGTSPASTMQKMVTPSGITNQKLGKYLPCRPGRFTLALFHKREIIQWPNEQRSLSGLCCSCLVLPY